MTALSRTVIRAMSTERWRTFEDIYHDCRTRIDAPRLQKLLSAMLSQGVLEMNTDRLCY
jgi:hypothetical protein